MVFSCFSQIAYACGNKSGEGESKQGQEGEENRWQSGEKGAMSAGELGGSEQPRDAARGTDGLLPLLSQPQAALWDRPILCSLLPSTPRLPLCLAPGSLRCTDCSWLGPRCWRPAGLGWSEQGRFGEHHPHKDEAPSTSCPARASHAHNQPSAARLWCSVLLGCGAPRQSSGLRGNHVPPPAKQS